VDIYDTLEYAIRLGLDPDGKEKLGYTVKPDSTES
jgi:hypothetical protein